MYRRNYGQNYLYRNKLKSVEQDDTNITEKLTPSRND